MTVYARVGNISQGGLFVCTSTPLITGASATLRFGQELAVETTAKVVWIHLGQNGVPLGMGLQFDQLDRLRAETIRRLIEAESAVLKNQS